jgi:ubiquinone/menaquinone biosynthesis C-methylase UbiE
VRDWTFNLKLYHLKAAGYITQHLSRNALIFDCGCGWGQVGKILQYCGYNNFSGLDISPRKVDTCKAVGLDVFVGSADYLPFSDGHFDCVVCMQVFEHLSKETYKKALEEIRRIVKSCGCIILSFPIGATATDKSHCVTFVDKETILGAMTDFGIVDEEEVFGRYNSAGTKSLFCALRKNEDTIHKP